MQIRARLLSITLVLLNSFSAFAASHTWSGAVNGLFSNAGNWSSGGVPTVAETNTLIFPPGATRTTVTNDIGGLKVGLFNFTGSNYIVRGTTTFTNGYNLINISCSGGSNTIEAAVNFPGLGYVTVGSSSTMVLSGILSGTNGLTKVGGGGLYLRGAASNPLSGDLIVFSGETHFQKTGGATPYNGNSIVIGSADVTDPTQLYLYANDMIPDGADVSLQPSGALVMNGFSDTVDSVTMYAGMIQTGAGILSINSALNLSPRFVSGLTYESPTIQGSIQFRGAACTINVSSNLCNIAGNIVDSGTATTLNKTGAGTLGLNGSGNNFTGALKINQGRVIAGTSSSLGSVGGATTVSAGCTLELSAGVNTSEPLNLSGLGTDGQGALQASSATCSGVITLTNETGIGVQNVSDTLTLSGPISGNGGIRKLGDGNLSLIGFGNNTFSGSSLVMRGKLTLGKSANVRAIGNVAVTNAAQLVLAANEQIDNSATLSVFSGGALTMIPYSESVGGLNLGGGATVDTGTGTLTMLGDVYAGPPYGTNGGAATIRGNLSLGGAIRTLQTSNTMLVLDCAISDGAGVGGIRQLWGYSAGDFGGISLLRSNSFTGPAYIYGFCSASNAFAFGAPGGGVWVTNSTYGTTLSLLHPTMSITGETLTAGSYLILQSSGTNAWNGPIMLQSNTFSTGYLECDAYPGALTIGGAISGPGSVECYNGLVRLSGSNSFMGACQASFGTLVIQHPSALGTTNQGTWIGDFAQLRLELTNGATVAGESLRFYSDYPGVYTNNHLVLAGAVSNNWNGPVIMERTPTRISVLEFNGTLKFNTAISGGGSLAKTGLGGLILAGNGSNQLTQLIAEHGSLRLAQIGGYALPTGDVVVLGDEILVIDGVPWSSPANIQLDQPGQLPPGTSLNLVGPEGGISLNNQNLNVRSVSGAGYIYTGAGTLLFSNAPGEFSLFYGRISSGSLGTNLVKLGGGGLHLHGPASTFFDGNSWHVFDSIALYGAVQVLGGYLDVTNGVVGSLQLATNTTAYARSAPDRFDAPAYVQIGLRVGSLSGSGALSLYDGAWVFVGNDNSTSVYDGGLDGGGLSKVIKTGTGALTLSKDGLNYGGSMSIENGTLLVNGAFNCNVLVQTNLYVGNSFATLGGTGQVGNVIVSGIGAAIAPGAAAITPSYGRLSLANLTLGPGGTYRCEINGTNAGANMDQINATATVTLSGGNIDVTAFGVGVTSNRYSVLKSTTPVSGTFLGRAQGSYIFPAAGRAVVVTYLSAGGKEVTLIEQQGSPIGNFGVAQITQLTNGQISLVGTGAPSVSYYVSANTNLNTTNWVPLGMVTGNAFNGGFSFTDTNAASFPRRFYRFILP